MAKRPRIAVVGSANVDLTTFTDRFPGPVRRSSAAASISASGGKGANQAVAARLVWRRRVHGRAGRGRPVRPRHHPELQEAGHRRRTRPDRDAATSSGVAPIFVEASGQNRIIVVKGANDRLRPADVDAAARRC